MSVAGKAQIARRPLLKGMFGAVALAVAAIAAVEAPRLFARRYPPSPYDDLLAQLPDRDSAARLGRSWIAQQTNFDAAKLAGNLRRRIGGHSLANVLDSDIAGMRMHEVHGWILPATLVELCGLAAKAD